jgi:exosortase A-associated hydrolase 2
VLAAEAAAKLDPVPDLVFWQPVISGRQHLQQFLRLRVASQFIGGTGEDRIGTAQLRAQLEEGATVDVAGYALAPAVALGLEAADLAPLPSPTRVLWLEVSPSEPPELSPAGRLRSEAWRAAGHSIKAEAVAGLPFWQTQETAECSALIDATRSAVLGLRA